MYVLNFVSSKSRKTLKEAKKAVTRSPLDVLTVEKEKSAEKF
jgi:hypothetical protein